MAEERHKIVIDLEKGDVERTLAALDDKIDDLKDTADNSASGLSKLQSSILTLDSALNIAGRGFDALQSLAGATFDAIERGSEVDAVATAFDNLSGGAERAASKLEALQAGTKGLVSDFDLMQSANSAALLGLDFTDKQFEELSSAALKLGSAVGTDAVSSIESLITALGRNSPLILDNLGVTLKLSEAYEIYAAQLGKAVDKLTEAEKAEAFRAAAIEKIIQKNRELSDINETAGVAFERLQTTITNTYDEIATAVNENEALADAFNNLSTTMANTDFTPIIDGLTSIITASANAVNEVVLVANELGNAFGRVVDGRVLDRFADELGDDLDAIKERVREVTGVFDEPVNAAGLERAAEVINRISSRLTAAGASAQTVQSILGPLNAQFSLMDVALDKGLNSTLEDLVKNGDLFGKELKKVEKATQGVTKATDKNSKELKEHDKFLKAISKATKEHSRQVEEQISQVSDFIFANGDLNESLERTQLVIDELSGDSFEDLQKAILETGEESIIAAAAQQKLNEIIEGIENGTITAEDGLRSYREEVAKLKGLLDDTGDSADGFFSKLSDGLGRFDGLAAEGFNIFGDILSGDLFGDPATLEEDLRAVGQALGAIVGGIFFGPAGAAAGSALGNFLPEIDDFFQEFLPKELGISGIVEQFQSKNKGRGERDIVDKMFEDLIDKQRIRLNIRGVVQEFETLNEEIVQIFNDTTGQFEDQTAYEGFFESLDLSTQEGIETFRGFESVGLAIAEMFHLVGDGAEQFGAILGNNLGGSLNNLQILLQTVGFSAEQLKEQIDNAWLAGEIGAAEALQATASVEDIFAQGIPGAIGKFDQAFQNLIESAGVGRLVLDSLGDIAVEAQEAGISTLEELKQQLIDSGADAEKVEALFNAISEAGITSLEQLADVSVQTAQVISSQLEQYPDFFNEAAQSIDELQAKLDQIQSKEVDITYNIRTNVDENTEKYRETLESNGTYVPSEAQGN